MIHLSTVFALCFISSFLFEAGAFRCEAWRCSVSRIEEVEALARAATPGPFDIERRDDDCGYMNYIVHGAKGDFAWCRDELDSRAKQNAAFVAAANPQFVLKLIAALKGANKMRSFSPEHPLMDAAFAVYCSDFDAAIAELEAT